MPINRKLRDFVEFFLLFLALYIIVQFSLKLFMPQYFGDEKNGQNGRMLTMQDKTVKDGHHPVVIIKNTTEEDLALEDKCPMPPFEVFKGEEKITTEETVLPCEALMEIKSGEKIKYDLSPWKYSLFSEMGEYKLVLTGTEEEVEFKVHEAGPVTKAFRAFITKPFLNLLVLIASKMPGYNLGIAIIILTILVKLILYIPTQQGLEGQKKMQAIQPKIETVKKKYKDDPKKMQEETMKLWEEYGVNPFQSCLPILIQFPILIGLFFVIRDGSVLELSRHLLYGPHLVLCWCFGTQFLGLNLLDPSKIIMPPLLVILQFSQMKLSFAIAKKKKDSKEHPSPGAKEKQKASSQEIQQKVMLYGLPLLIGFFALQFPAAVSLYWGVSTVFAIGQQLVVNRKELK